MKDFEFANYPKGYPEVDLQKFSKNLTRNLFFEVNIVVWFGFMKYQQL